MAESKLNPQSSLHCHHCAGPLSKEMETSEWNVRPLIRDSFSMIGSAVGGTTSAFYGFNHGRKASSEGARELQIASVDAFHCLNSSLQIVVSLKIAFLYTISDYRHFTILSFFRPNKNVIGAHFLHKYVHKPYKAICYIFFTYHLHCMYLCTIFAFLHYGIYFSISSLLGLEHEELFLLTKLCNHWELFPFPPFLMNIFVNAVMPIVRRWVKGPMWLHFFVGAPPVIVFSSACAGLAGGAVPALAQLASSSYHAAVSSRSLPPPSKDDKMHKSRNSSTL